jgi:hypothetical protein
MRASPQGSIGCCPDAAQLDTSIHSPEGLGQRGNQPGRGGGGRGHFANVQNRASDTLAPGAIVADAGRHLGVVQRARVSGLARASRPGRDGSIHAARPKERRRAPRSKQGREDLGEEGRHARRCGQVRGGGGGAAETKSAAGTAKKKGAKRTPTTTSSNGMPSSSTRRSSVPAADTTTTSSARHSTTRSTTCGTTTGQTTSMANPRPSRAGSNIGQLSRREPDTLRRTPPQLHPKQDPLHGARP